MKIKIFVITLLFSGFWYTGYSQQSGKDFDNEEGSSMMPIIYDLDTLVNIVENSFKAQIVRMEFDIVKDTSYSARVLYPGFKYGIFVYGDYRIDKIGLDILKQNQENFEFVSSGNIDKNTCLGWVEATEPALYTFKIFIIDREPGFKGGHYGILIFN